MNELGSRDFGIKLDTRGDPTWIIPAPGPIPLISKLDTSLNFKNLQTQTAAFKPPGAGTEVTCFRHKEFSVRNSCKPGSWRELEFWSFRCFNDTAGHEKKCKRSSHFGGFIIDTDLSFDDHLPQSFYSAQHILLNYQCCLDMTHLIHLTKK